MDYLSDKHSEEYYALIHTAIPDKKVYQIPGAKDVVEKEWDKLFKLGTFDLLTVAEKRDVAKRYKLKNEKVHIVNCRYIYESIKEEWSSVETSSKTKTAGMQCSLNRARLRVTWQLRNSWML